jgi:ketosteroid isomerase-like protein
MADTQAANIAAVREGIEATNRGDLESVVAGLDPEFEFHIAPGLGNAGTYHGREGYREGFGGWAEASDDFTVEAVDVRAVGERHVAVDARQSARGHGSGVEVGMRLGYMFEIRNGRLFRFHVLPSYEAALSAATEGERRRERAL